jgi:tetratricopeptide (TPR) repeat protein
LGTTNSLIKLNDSPKAEEFLKVRIQNFDSTSFYFAMELLLGDIYVRNNKFNEAKIIYSRLKKQNPSIDYSNLAFSRLYLLGQSTKILRNYIEGSYYEKYKLLSNINRIRTRYEMIPAMINLSNALEENYKNFISRFKRRVLVNNFTSSNAVYQLSKHATINSDYLTALGFARLTLNININKNVNSCYQRNYDKINWLINSGEKVKKEFRKISTR